MEKREVKNFIKKLLEKMFEQGKLVAIYLMIYDIVIINLSYLMGLWIRFDGHYRSIPKMYLISWAKFIPVYTLFCLFTFYGLRLYQSIWKYASYNELTRIMMATVISGVFHAVGITVFLNRMPITYYAFGILLQFTFMLSIRFSYRFVSLERVKKNSQFANARISRVMLVGAGEAGRLILRDMNMNKESMDKVVCIIDDNPHKQKRYMDGIEVYGGRESILQAAEKFNINKIVVAIPSATKEQKRDILNICKETGCELMNLPGMYKLVSGDVSAKELKEVAIEDLLGRDTIRVNMQEIYDNIKGKVILVTGVGSIGSEICRQIAKHSPKQLIMFDIYENNIYDIQQELIRKYPKLNLAAEVGSTREWRRVEYVLNKYQPDVVYHAAAHKHVPLMEGNPNEAVKNNVIGTYNVAYSAMMNNCRRFVLISTDKAVNPTNVMGATKRMCEMVVQSFDRMIKSGCISDIPRLFPEMDSVYADRLKKVSTAERQWTSSKETEFVAVRFGNVLGSNGSVIPLFKKQIQEGGPVTVTHPDIIRYFMTIPEAVSLVLQAGTYALGGEIFILDMGSPVKIEDLARNLIKLSGLRPDEDIKLEYIGLRPGEKLYEEKLMAEEGLTRTANKLIHIAKPIDFNSEVFFQQLQNLMEIMADETIDIKEIIKEMVSTYIPAVDTPILSLEDEAAAIEMEKENGKENSGRYVAAHSTVSGKKVKKTAISTAS